jgi:hypothetical protein
VLLSNDEYHLSVWPCPFWLQNLLNSEPALFFYGTSGAIGLFIWARACAWLSAPPSVSSPGWAFRRRAVCWWCPVPCDDSVEHGGCTTCCNSGEISGKFSPMFCLPGCSYCLSLIGKFHMYMAWYLFQYLREILSARLSVLNMFGGLFHQFTTLR